TALLLSSVGSDTARVVARDIEKGTDTEIASSPDVDAGAVFAHPTKRIVQAVGFDKGRREWKVVDPSVSADFEAIGKLSDGDFNVVNRDRADKTWLVSFNADNGPIKFFTYDRETKKGTLMFTHQPKLEHLPLASMKPVTIPARDGLNLPA